MTRDDRGETLLELVVALAIMGTALVAVIGAFGTSILMSDVHRKQAEAGMLVRAYVEAVEKAVAAGGYVDCAGTAAYDLPGHPVSAGYAKSVVAVRHWDGSGWQPEHSGCSADKGLQQVTLQVKSDDERAVEKLAVVLRKP